MKENDPASKVENPENRLEAVRDLLFGPNDQQYRKEFQEVREQIAGVSEASKQSTSKLHEELIGKIDALEKGLLSQIKTLEGSVAALAQEKTDKKQLAKLLQVLAAELEA